MSRALAPGLQQAFLHDALIDLATAADRQAALASRIEGTAASCALFILADQLRAMAHQVNTDPGDGPTALLEADAAQARTAISSLERSGD